MRDKARHGTEKARRTLRNRSLRIGIGLAALFAFGLMASGAFGESLSIVGTTTDTTSASSASTSDTTSTPSTDTSSTDTSSTDTSTTATYTPTVTTDQLDYSPGSTVTISGAGWPAGDSITVFTNDAIGNTWSNTDHVTAGDDGSFTDQVTLPDNFISNYTVKASDASGLSATTTFTDAGAALEGQSNPACTGGGSCDNGWEGNVAGWAENQQVPMRIKFTGNLANFAVEIPFNATGTGTHGTTFGIASLGNFVAGSGVTINTPPSLCVSSGSNWAECLNVTVTGASNSNPKFLNFSALLAIGAHNFSGNSIQIGQNAGLASASPTGMGTVKITQPGAASGNANLAVTKTCTSGCTSSGTGTYTATPGSTVVFQLAFQNNNAGAATSVALRDILDADLSYVSCTSTTGLTTNASCSEVGNIVTWTIPSLAAGGSGTATVTATVPSTSSFSVVNEGNITNPQANTDPNNGDSQITITNPPAGKHSTSTSVACTPSTLTYGGSTSCTATVTDTASSGKTSPGGTVTFDDGGASGSFSSTTCTLTSASSSSSSCTASVTYTPSAAGSPTITGTYGGDGTHNGSNGNTGLTVDKANPTCSISGYTVTYDGSSHAASGDCVGVDGTTVLSGLNKSGTTHTDAGTYGADPWTFTDSTGNYNDTSGTVADEIDQAGATVTVDCTGTPFTYDGSAHGCTASWTSTGDDGIGGPLSVSYDGRGTTSYGPSASAPSDAGDYTGSASFSGDANHTGNTNSTDFVIQKAASVTMVICAGTPFTYDGSSHTYCTASATGAGNLNQPLTVSYTGRNTTSYGPDTTGPIDAGDYTGSASFSGDANHTGSNNTAYFTINKAGSTVTVTCTGTPFTYDATSHGCTASWASTSSDNGGDSLTISYSGRGTTSYGPSASAPSDAGDYTGSASFSGDANHTGNTGSADFVIQKANPDCSSITGYTVTYDGSFHSASGSCVGVDGTTALTGLDKSGTTHKNAATYNNDPWTFTDVTGNYNDESSTVDDKINQAGSTVTVTCTGTPFTYNGSPHGCTAAWASTSTDAEGASLSVSYSGRNTTSYGPSNTPPTNAGDYTGSASFSGDTNHTGNSNSSNFTINKAGSTVTVTCTGTPFTYDGTTHGCAATWTSTSTDDEGDSLVVSYGGRNTTSYGPSNTPPTNAGDYTGSATFAGDTNHTGNTGSTNFVIQKANQTITFATLPDRAYGTPDFSVSATASSSLDVSFSATGSCTINGSPGGTWTVHLTNTGSCTITASQAGNGNYNPAQNVMRTFAITPGVGTVAYIGQTVFVSSGSSSTTVQAHLTASVVADGGSIAQAKVTFTDLLTNTVLAKGVPVTPVANSSEPTGTADTIVTLSTGKYGANGYLIEVKLDTTAGSSYANHQQLDSQHDPLGTAAPNSDPWNAAHPNLVAMIPQTTNTLAGGATIGANGCPTSTGACAPAGSYADATHVYYTAGMGWTSKGTNPQGQIQLTLERGDGTYFIKSNSITSVAFSNPVNRVNKDVTIYTKASIYKVTASGLTSVDGNVTLRMDAHDGGQTGDTVGFTVLSSKTGSLYYSNNWVYDTTILGWKTVQQAVSAAGGCAIQIG